MGTNLGKAPRARDKEPGDQELLCDDLGQHTIPRASDFSSIKPEGCPYSFEFSFRSTVRGNRSFLKT